MKNVRRVKYLIMICLLLTMFMFSSEITLAYLLDKTSPVVSKFVPYKYSTNDLIISKLIEHPLGDNYVIPDNMKFEFKIDLGSYYANQSIVTSQGEFKTNENGIFNINIKPNVDVVISSIEENTNVKVTEIVDEPGFIAKDDAVKEITISSTEGSKIQFINVYNPELVVGKNITLNSKKVLEGRTWQDGDSFTFKLEYLNEINEWILLGEKTITYDENNVNFNTFDFNEMIQSFEFKNVGTYKFRLSEVEGNLENVYYDKTINNFEILIADETMDGKLEIKEINGYQNVKILNVDNKYDINVLFNNTYISEEPGEDTEIEYVDKVDQSVLVDDLIIVKDNEYTIETVVSNFDGLSENYTYTVYDKNGNEYNGDLVRTGDYIVIKDNNVEYNYDVVLSGDTSGDGLVTPLDYVKIKNHIIGNTRLSGVPYMLAADMSGDGLITPLDYIKVKNQIIKGGK